MCQKAKRCAKYEQLWDFPPPQKVHLFVFSSAQRSAGATRDGRKCMLRALAARAKPSFENHPEPKPD